MGTVYLSLFCSVEFKNFFFFYYLLPIFNIWDPTPLLFACGVSFACLVLQLLYYMTPGRLLHFSESPHLNSGDNNNNYTLQGCHEGPARCYMNLEQFLTHIRCLLNTSQINTWIGICIQGINVCFLFFSSNIRLPINWALAVGQGPLPSVPPKGATCGGLANTWAFGSLIPGHQRCPLSTCHFSHPWFSPNQSLRCVHGTSESFN